MLSQYPQSAFQGFSGVARGGQQQFAAQTLRVHLLSVNNIPVITPPLARELSCDAGNPTQRRHLSESCAIPDEGDKMDAILLWLLFGGGNSR